jgi:hypothetical protein
MQPMRQPQRLDPAVLAVVEALARWQAARDYARACEGDGAVTTILDRIDHAIAHEPHVAVVILTEAQADAFKAELESLAQLVDDPTVRLPADLFAVYRGVKITTDPGRFQAERIMAAGIWGEFAALDLRAVPA